MRKSKPENGDKSAPAEKRFNRGKPGTYPLDKAFEPKPEGVVEVLGGDELQTLTMVWKDDFRLFMEGDFWRNLETILANCDEVMLRHGWNRHEGNGRDFPGDRTAEPFSELWYAGKIGFECWNLLNWHRVHGPNEIALSQAMYLGKLLSEAEWRAAFKRSIVTGKGVRTGASKGGDTRSGSYLATNNAILESMKKFLEANHTVSRAAELTFKNGLGKSTAANRALWYRKGKMTSRLK
jgi:hypothetical protein